MSNKKNQRSSRRQLKVPANFIDHVVSNLSNRHNDDSSSASAKIRAQGIGENRELMDQGNDKAWGMPENATIDNTTTKVPIVSDTVNNSTVL